MRSTEIREWLKVTFPHCFIKGEAKKPLKIGIKEDVLAYCTQHYPDLDKVQLSAAIKQYTSSKTYLAQVLENTPRVDLEGQAVGMVSSKEAGYARMRLRTALELHSKKTD